MKYFYNQLFANKCEVHACCDELVFPIFKNGSSTIIENSKRVYLNQQIAKLDTITVYWREACQRYCVGVASYLEWNKHLNTNTLLELINTGQLLNNHFCSQYMWLQNLARYSPDHSIRIEHYSDIPIDTVKMSSDKLDIPDVDIPQGWCELDNIIYGQFGYNKVTLKEIDSYIEQNHRTLYKRCIAHV